MNAVSQLQSIAPQNRTPMRAAPAVAPAEPEASVSPAAVIAESDGTTSGQVDIIV